MDAAQPCLLCQRSSPKRACAANICLPRKKKIVSIMVERKESLTIADINHSQLKAASLTYKSRHHHRPEDQKTQVNPRVIGQADLREVIQLVSGPPLLFEECVVEWFSLASANDEVSIDSAKPT